MSNSFKTLGFAPQLEKLIEVNGFTSPTPIQMKAIPLGSTGIRSFGSRSDRNR